MSSKAICEGPSTPDGQREKKKEETGVNTCEEMPAFDLHVQRQASM